jgi:hypothetical protein
MGERSSAKAGLLVKRLIVWRIFHTQGADLQGRMRRMTVRFPQLKNPARLGKSLKRKEKSW